MRLPLLILTVGFAVLAFWIVSQQLFTLNAGIRAANANGLLDSVLDLPIYMLLLFIVAPLVMALASIFWRR